MRNAPECRFPMHESSQFDLLRQRRFAPFFWTQALGAGNDNVFKNALVIFVAYHAATLTAIDANTLVNLAAAVFIAPFVLLSATSGQLADKFEKSRLIRYIKVFEIAIMALGLVGFWWRNLTLLFVALALMGVHSTLFGPVKYAILPQHLKTDELVGGNGLVEMGTFVAILVGTIVGGLLVAVTPNGPVMAGAAAVAVAVAGWLASRAIPVTPAVAPDLRINWNPFTETWKNLTFARGNRVVWLSMLGISWFWFYGATFLTQFPNFAKNVLGGDEHVVTFLLASFSIGIGAGSLLCERLSGHRVELGLVPFGSIGLTLFAVDLWFATHAMHATGLSGVGAFLAQPAHWRVTADLVLIGLFGGFYIVPLYALIQERSEPTHRSRIIAANNILNALFMVASAGLAIVLLAMDVSIPGLFLATGDPQRVRRAVHLQAGPRVPDALPRVAADPHDVPRAQGGSGERPGAGRLHPRLQSRELRRRDRHRRLRAPAGALHHGPPHLPRAAAQLGVPHDERDTRGFRQGRSRGQGVRVRVRRRRAARRRDRRHLSRGQADGQRRDEPVPFGHRADGEGHAGAGGADGAARTVGQLLQPLLRGQGDAPLAWRVLAHRASSSRRRCRRRARRRKRCTRRCWRCAAMRADRLHAAHAGTRHPPC